MDAKELKPCPFCGGTPHFERLGTGRRSCIVECGSCGVRHESGDEGSMCGNSWNHRAASDAAQAPTVPRESQDKPTQDQIDTFIKAYFMADCDGQVGRIIAGVKAVYPAPVAAQAAGDTAQASRDTKAFEQSLWELVEQARAWEAAYRDSGTLYESLDSYKTEVEQQVRHIVNSTSAAPVHPAAVAQPKTQIRVMEGNQRVSESAAQPDERAAFDEIRSALDETYRFASTSPRALDNINFVLDKLDEIEKARATAPQATVKGDEPVRYFVHDNDWNYTEYSTDAERDAAHKSAIKEYLDDGLTESAEGVVSGIVTHKTVAIKAGDGSCDYVARAAVPQAKLTDEQVNEIMEQVQVYASAYSLIGGVFDFGNALETADQEKANLHALLAAAQGGGQ